MKAHRRRRQRSLADSALRGGERESRLIRRRGGGGGAAAREATVEAEERQRHGSLADCVDTMAQETTVEATGRGASASWFAGRFSTSRKRKRAYCFSAEPQAEPSTRRLGARQRRQPAEPEAWWFASSFREWGSGLIKRGGEGERERERAGNHFEPGLINEGNFFCLGNRTEFNGERGEGVKMRNLY